MDIKELFKGVAVVIDDEVYDERKQIFKIIAQLEKENIPILKYEYLPENDEVINFQNVSFVLLDWELQPTITDSSTSSVTGATDTIVIKPSGSESNENIEFIKYLREISFIPIFIFSHLDSNTIITKLEENGLYKKGTSNYIFVKAKNNLVSEENALFNEIYNWLKQTPSIYVLKEWEKSLNEAKNKLFWDFYNINHKWPSVLQKTFTEDGSDVNYELGNFIFKNIMARTEPIEFDKEILKIEDNDLTKEEIRKVLEAERFINNDSLPPNIPFTGDLFALHHYEIIVDSKKEKEKLFINIRPDCDIIRDKDNIEKGQKALVNDNPDYNPNLYCLECEVVKDKDIELDKGAIIERKNSSIIPFVYNGKILKINFDKIHIFQWNQSLMTKEGTKERIFKEARVGRVLPPYITAIQQKYAFYLQRQGLPAIPEKAIKND